MEHSFRGSTKRAKKRNVCPSLLPNFQFCCLLALASTRQALALLGPNRERQHNHNLNGHKAAQSTKGDANDTQKIDNKSQNHFIPNPF